MNRFLFKAADFLSRPPGFYFVLLAMVISTALVPFGWTDVVTYALSVVAIAITGWVSDRYSFAPILIGASILPLIAMAAMLLLVRNTQETRQKILNEI